MRLLPLQMLSTSNPFNPALARKTTMDKICELRATYNDFLSLQDQTDTIPLTRALDAVGLALEALEGPLNEDPSGQRRETMSPSPLDDEPPFPEQHDGHVVAFRWQERMWMEREYRNAGERLS